MNRHQMNKHNTVGEVEMTAGWQFVILIDGLNTISDSLWRERLRRQMYICLNLGPTIDRYPEKYGQRKLFREGQSRVEIPLQSKCNGQPCCPVDRSPHPIRSREWWWLQLQYVSNLVHLGQWHRKLKFPMSSMQDEHCVRRYRHIGIVFHITQVR